MNSKDFTDLANALTEAMNKHIDDVMAHHLSQVPALIRRELDAFSGSVLRDVLREKLKGSISVAVEIKEAGGNMDAFG